MKAVDYLVKELHEYYMGRSEFGRDEIIEQANKMFEQQVKDGYDHMRCIGNFENGEQYYNETYGSKGSAVAKRLKEEMPQHIADTVDAYAEKIAYLEKFIIDEQLKNKS